MIPGTVRAVVLLLAAAAAVAGAAPLRGAPGAVAEARGVLQQVVDAGEAPGIGAAVALRGEIVWSEGFGFADLERRIPVTDETRFGIGSISKTLTMAVAARLAERGVLDLDAPVERYLPGFPHAGRGITVRRLAAHQSGMSDAFAVAHYTTRRHFAALDAAYREIAAVPLAYEPGSRVEYATGTYTVIGRVLEAAAGRDYRRLMREELFAVAGLAGIVPNDPGAAVPHRTVFYATRAGGGFEPAPGVDPSHKLPGAGFLATARDIASLGAALLGPRVFGDRGRAEMFRDVRLTDGSATGFALGLRVGSHGTSRLLHLPGGGVGISSWLFIHPDEALVVALLANVNTAPVGGRTHRLIADAFLRAR